LLQLVVQGLHRPLDRGGSLGCCRCLFRSGQCFCPSHRAWAGRDLQGTSGHHSRLCRFVTAGHRGTRCLASRAFPVGNRIQDLNPWTQGSWGAPLRRCFDAREVRAGGRAVLRGSTTMTMGQGAHHLGTSPAPAPHNVLLGQGIGASSLPAPPLVTTRAVPGVLAQRPGSIACAAQGCGTRSVEGSARHMGHGSVRTGERCRQSQCRGLDTHGAMPGRLAPDCEDAAATHNLSQRNFRLNPRPGRARRLSKAGRHWAPIDRQRATRKERHSGLAWPTYCDKPKRAPPVMDGMVRTVTHGVRRCHAENESLHRTFIMELLATRFRRSSRRCLNVS
jgi:hypothetical protein